MLLITFLFDEREMGQLWELEMVDSQIHKFRRREQLGDTEGLHRSTHSIYVMNFLVKYLYFL